MQDLFGNLMTPYFLVRAVADGLHFLGGGITVATVVEYFALSV